jgi:hypothetical protein
MPEPMRTPAVQPVAAPAVDPRGDLSPMERQLLATIARLEPAAADRLPTRWPLIRMHLPLVLERLVSAGLVRVLPSAGVGGTATLTDLGRAALDQGPTYPSAGSRRARTPLELSVRK